MRSESASGHLLPWQTFGQKEAGRELLWDGPVGPGGPSTAPKEHGRPLVGTDAQMWLPDVRRG